MTTSEAAKAQMAELAARREAIKVEAAKHPSAWGARRFGELAAIEAGMEVWTDSDPMTDVPPRGGIVLSVNLGGTHLDAETGEIIEHAVSYRCYDPQGWPSHPFVTIPEAEILRDSVGVPHSSRLVHAVRRFARELCDHTRRRAPGSFDAWDAELAQALWQLTRVIMGEK